jgi:CRP-like cAMP-binding protein
MLDVADAYARDGFHGRATAVLSKVQRFAPDDERIAQRLRRLERAKRLEHLQTAAAFGVAEADGRGERPSLPERQRIWQNLAESSFLDGLDELQARKLFAAVQLVRLADGAPAVEEGTSDERLFLVVDGSLDADVAVADGGHPRVRAFGPGDMVGESALLQHRPWPATYRANGRCLLLALDHDGLEAALHGNPDPRRLLDLLRSQGNDQLVRAMAIELGAAARS